MPHPALAAETSAAACTDSSGSSIPLMARLRPTANISQAASAPVSAPDRPGARLPAGYSASAELPSKASPDPCLRCVKRMDRAPWIGCLKVRHTSCTPCVVSRKPCEPVPTRFRALALRVERCAAKVARHRATVAITRRLSREAYKKAKERCFAAERRLLYRHAVFCRRVEAWERMEAALSHEEQVLRALKGIHGYGKAIAHAVCTLAETPFPPDSDEEPLEEDWRDLVGTPAASEDGSPATSEDGCSSSEEAIDAAVRVSSKKRPQ
ncbi:hypothetical protein GP486_001738 [Trichoglossum hirsutum]|uniref:Uncharacterized protein n=1 Tax=Trichoglossum hirsutum TaxID=265104 RepID=A0A9P8LGA0_9PEZI|nr:hypothetical protein GP486_001738 [Trichoglossum hirsutum]